MDDELLKLTAGRLRKKVARPGRPRYPHRLDAQLELLWVLHNCPCGKRLTPALRENRDTLLRSPALGISVEDYDAIAAMSPATIDRRLRGKHTGQGLKGITHTRPAKALKNLVPVRTWATGRMPVPGSSRRTPSGMMAATRGGTSISPSPWSTSLRAGPSSAPFAIGGSLDFRGSGRHPLEPALPPSGSSHRQWQRVHQPHRRGLLHPQ